MNTLAPRQYDNLKFPDIGRVLGIDKDAARQRHNRAVDRLAEIVGKLRRGELADLLPGEGGDESAPPQATNRLTMGECD